MTVLLRNRFIAIVVISMMAISACSDAPAAPADADTSATESATETEETPVAEEEPADNESEDAAEESSEDSADASSDTEEDAPVTAAMTKLNLNTVTSEELLATIPDFGNRMVREFEEYRPYISIQQFRREIGKYVDEAQVADYEQYVYVPIKVNEADAETLKQLPGVDDAIAESLIAARPYESNAAFLEALSASISVDDASVAEAYLEVE